MTAPKRHDGDHTRRASRRAAAARGGAALLLAASLALLGCGDYGGGGSAGGGSTSSAAAAPPSGGGGSLPDPTTAMPVFATTVLPVLQANCAGCHAGAGPGSPDIAHSDTATAYFANMNNQKVNLGNPIASRLVLRLAVDSHYCWSVCTDNAETMRAAIADWATQIAYTGGGVDPGIIRTDTRALADGVLLDSSDQRYSQNQIALWEFKEGSGTVAADTSNVAPAMDLTIEGADVSWLTSYGLDIVDGRAIADPTTARKLYDRIAAPGTGSGQYTVEAWVVPANVSQEGPARIISYSRGTGTRNFTLGQHLYQYDFRNRNVSSLISANGTPALRTYDMDRDLQATLQHVVITYDTTNGRAVYVDGTWTDDVDGQDVQPLYNWDPNHAFILGNEFSNNRQWEGKLQLVAIYNQVLSPEQINQNYLAGVGRKVVLRFDMSSWAGPGAYLEFLVSELDSNAYLFCQPVFYASDPNGTRVAGLRIVVNGVTPVNGQAFANVDSASFGQPTQISRLCSVISQDQGAANDQFEIDVEIVDNFEHAFTDTVTPFGADPSVNPPPAIEGVRDFDRLNATMASLTGVSPATPAVRAEFTALKQQLPASTDMRSFVSSNQVGIAKLALEYCDALVEDPLLRDAFFGPGSTFPFDQDVATAFAGTNRSLVIDPLVARMVGSGIPNQPDPAQVTAQLDQLTTDLINSCTVCDAQRTRDTVKALCVGVLSSAAVTLH